MINVICPSVDIKTGPMLVLDTLFSACGKALTQNIIYENLYY